MLLDDKDAAVVANFVKNQDISGWYKNHDGGMNLQAFQEKFAEFCTAKHAFGVSSGSAALYVALRAVGVKPGDYVAVPTYTHVGSVAPILLCGAKPVFIDCDKYGNIDGFDLARSLALYKYYGKVKAIIAVHQLGLPCNMDAIGKVANRSILTLESGLSLLTPIPIIEDASHAMGSEYNGKKTGVLGDIGCFSIGGGRTKIIGTGEGGMVTTNDDGLAERIKNIRNHGDRYTDVPYLCFNFRMSDLNALIGLLQMAHLKEWLHWQKHNAEYIISRLPKYLEVPDVPSYATTNRYLIGCTYNEIRAGGMTRDQWMEKVREGGFEGGQPRRNIGTGYSKLVSDIKIYQKYHRKYSARASKRLRDTAIWIDWHRWPRNIDEIDDMLEFLRGLM